MDSQIIALLQKRDELALHKIRESYGQLCRELAYQISGSRQDAEECVNDMLLAVWNSTALPEPQNLKAYLVSLVRHAAINQLKSRQRQKRGGKQFSLSLDELAEIIPAEEQVEKQIEQKELTAALTAWLRSLQPEMRCIFIQRYFMSDSIQSIAEQNHMSISAVKMRLLRARGNLKEYLQKEGFL